MSAFSFRPAEPEDIERLVEIHALAFPDARGHEERRRNFLAKPFGPYADLHVATTHLGGREAIVGHAFGFGLSAYVGGVDVPVLGIATVGVAPEARGLGVATALVEHLHRLGKNAGMVAAFLYPFRQGFYRRLGYVSAPTVEHVSVAIDALVELRDRGAAVRPGSGDDRHTFAELYTSEARRTTGMLVRTERLWNMHFADERRAYLVLERDGGDAGYVSFSLEQTEPHGETRLDVVDLVGRSVADRRRLLGALATFRDQVSEVDLCLPSDDPLLVELRDLDVDRRRFGTSRIEHRLGSVGSGPMLKLLSARAALEGRGYRHDGAFRFTVDGESFGLVVRGGRGHVVADGEGRPLAFDARALAAVVYGGLSLSRAAALGWVVADPETLHVAARVLEVPAWHTWDRF